MRPTRSRRRFRHALWTLSVAIVVNGGCSATTTPDGSTAAATAQRETGNEDPARSRSGETSQRSAGPVDRETATPRAIPTSEREWRERLTPEEFYVLREKGTERAFSGAYHDHHADGVYHCAGCGTPLFASEDKFDSGTGWPSFTRPMSPNRVATEVDNSFRMQRTEVLCGTCGGHLGHVFEDGPRPSGLRYCINSVSLDFSATRGGDR